MTKHNRDKDQENYLLDQARTICDEIEVSVFGPSGVDTPPCAEAWSTAKLIAELRSRVEALEASVKPAESNHPAEPDSSLVELVSDALMESVKDQRSMARAAIRQIAAWLQRESYLHLGSGSYWAKQLQKEAR